MLCENCNAEISDNSAYCTNCGKPIVKKNMLEISNHDKPKNDKLFYKLASTSGIIFMILGVIFFCMSFSSLELTSFGGDFYTYTYEGIYVISGMLSLLTKISSCILFAIGVFIKGYFDKLR